MNFYLIFIFFKSKIGTTQFISFASSINFYVLILYEFLYRMIGNLMTQMKNLTNYHSSHDKAVMS